MIRGDTWDASGYPAHPRGTGRRVGYDTEGNGLLDEVDRFHCIGAIDLDTGEEFYFGVDQGPGSGRHLCDGLVFLEECDLAVAHNGYDYDRRALKKVYPDYAGPKHEWDTLVLCKVIWPADVLMGPDWDRVKKGLMPAQLAKRHSLKAWGYRTGTFKGEYTGGFEQWSPAMADYMMQDVRGLVAIWRLAMKRLGWEGAPAGTYVWPKEPIEVEHRVHAIILEQTRVGVRFDVDKAVKLAAELQTKQRELEVKLVEVFGSWWQTWTADLENGERPAREMARNLVGFEDVTAPRFSKAGKPLAPYVGPPKEYLSPDAPFVRIERMKFNPGSRQHLGLRLQAVYGWKPKEFGKNGDPTVDETTLEAIPTAVLPADVRQTILDYLVVTKTLGSLSKGQRSWLRLGESGSIHGRVDPLGTVTHRATSTNPALHGTPKVKKRKTGEKDAKGKAIEVALRGLAGRYGYECRDLFVADEGWEQTGIDMSALELILLGHYMWPYDDGAFSARVCDPERDPHAENAVLMQVPRDNAKTGIYLKVYGGSAFKMSLDTAIVVEPGEVPELIGYRGLPALLRNLEARFGPEFVAKMDDMQKARLVRCRLIIKAMDDNIVGLKDFQDGAVKVGGERGWVKGMDGRRIHVRKSYAAPNTILQGGGAEACKLWMILLHDALEAAGLRHLQDWKQVLWVHDELQITHRPGLGPTIARLAEETAVRAGEMLGLKGRFRTDAKTGGSWAECH